MMPFAMPAGPPLDPVDAAEACDLLAAGAVLVDVREADEYAYTHVPGAHHIPLSRFPDGLDELPRDREVLFICHSGVRSALAAAIARRCGLARATNIRGGMLAWEDEDLPIERREAA